MRCFLIIPNIKNINNLAVMVFKKVGRPKPEENKL